MATKDPHKLDDVALGKFLVGKLPNLKLPVTSTKIGYGQSNPTYFVDDAVKERYILRKRPTGVIISPVAHQVDREFRILEALGKTSFPVPKVYCLCEDSSVIGTSFYVMEFIKGRIITDPNLSELSPSDRRAVWFSAIDTLAQLHSINPKSIDLDNFGKGTEFYKRQCNTFSRIEGQQAMVKNKETHKPLGRAHEKYDEVVNFVRNNTPGERIAIIHGDFKFDNLILHPTEPRVIAVLDWELSTVGHPLIDTVYILSPYWFHPTPIYRPENQGMAGGGMPSQDEIIRRYKTVVGFDPREDKWQVAQIFHLVRAGTISHGIQARTITGQASSEFSHKYFQNTKDYLDTAFEMMQEVLDNKTALSRL